jgi:hypothetical protein
MRRRRRAAVLNQASLLEHPDTEQAPMPVGRRELHPRPLVFGRLPESVSAFMAAVLRKEVIQPQVPLRLPCYDFTPVADLTVDGCAPCGFTHRLKVKPTPMV